ncbi:MAG: hypothetical protein F4076_00050, partial [Acidimicrobiaceae bacterium]|nr:hypothetical protein [Acidimicrobiaceae bacterium]
MESRSPLERGVAWMLFVVLVAGAVVSIALDPGDSDTVAPRESPQVETATAADDATPAASEGPTTTAAV